MQTTTSCTVPGPRQRATPWVRPDQKQGVDQVGDRVSDPPRKYNPAPTFGAKMSLSSGTISKTRTHTDWRETLSLSNLDRPRVLKRKKLFAQERPLPPSTHNSSGPSSPEPTSWVAPSLCYGEGEGLSGEPKRNHFPSSPNLRSITCQSVKGRTLPSRGNTVRTPVGRTGTGSGAGVKGRVRTGRSRLGPGTVEE